MRQLIGQETCSSDLEPEMGHVSGQEREKDEDHGKGQTSEGENRHMDAADRLG